MTPTRRARLSFVACRPPEPGRANSAWIVARALRRGLPSMPGGSVRSENKGVSSRVEYVTLEDYRSAQEPFRDGSISYANL